MQLDARCAGRRRPAPSASPHRSRFAPTSRSPSSTASRAGWSGRSATSSTTRSSGASRGAWSSCGVARRRGGGARPRPGHRRCRPATCLRPVLSGGLRPGVARLGAGAGHRQAGGLGARWLGDHRVAARRRDAGAPHAPRALSVSRSGRAGGRCRTGRGRPDPRPSPRQDRRPRQRAPRHASRSAASGSTIVAWRSAAVSGRRRPAAGALPGVGAEVVVVAAGAEERGLVAERGHQVEAEHVAVERDRLRDAGHLAGGRAPSPCRRAARRTAPWRDRPARRGGSRRRAARVVSRRGDLALPERARAVPVDLDAVPVRVAEVDRLADEVVGEPGERHPVARRRARASARGRAARARAGRSGRGPV